MYFEFEFFFGFFFRSLALVLVDFIVHIELYCQFAIASLSLLATRSSLLYYNRHI